jgi:hypothetical protein
MILDLQKIWNTMNFISEQEDVLNEKDIYPYFLGMRSNYYKQDFNSFLDHYSVKINTDYIIVFNDDGVPYEDYTNDDFSYLPKELLDFNEKQLKDWIDKEVDIHLKRVDKNKEEEREYIKSQINILTKKLEQL